MSLISLKQLDIKPYSTANRNGSTSATPNTWTQVAVITASSSHVSITNPIGSIATLKIGFGAAAAEFEVHALSPGKSMRVGSRDRISVRCAIASQLYTASEGVYI